MAKTSFFTSAPVTVRLLLLSNPEFPNRITAVKSAIFSLMGSLSRPNDKDQRSLTPIGPCSGQTGWGAVLLGFAIFGLLWILDTPYREFYVPNMDDIPALADGLLLAPGAQWDDWFTRGYSNYWDVYPEWPPGGTGFTRPAFQFVIYLAHFALGRNWELYRIISCFAAASVAAVAFLIARTALGLRTGLSLLAAALVVLSPPVLDCWRLGLAGAHEPLTTLLIACAFLAVVARRDFLCLMLLFAALLTKENAVWAPAAAAITIMLRPKPDEPLRRQAIAAAAMFLPVVLWLGLRFAFFGGIGGTYATAGYTPLGDFLALTFKKLKNLDALFVVQHAFVTEGHGALLDRAIILGTRLLTYALLSLLALRLMPEIANRLRYAMYERRWPTVEATLLVPLWAAIALAFHFALALDFPRYATSLVVFAWPALVAEIDRRRQAVLWLGLTVFCVVSTLRSYRFVDERPPDPRKYSPLRVALHQMPMATQQVYILADNYAVPLANPEYVRLILGVPAEIVRIIGVNWNCGESNNFVSFNHSMADGVVKLTVTLPACANFSFSSFSSRIWEKAFANGRLYRNATMSYELPEADPKQKGSFEVGRRITVHVRPSGPARFIIQHGGPNGIAWFDTS
jgi:hypothetical protein